MRLIDASALMVAVEGNPLTTDSLKEYVRCVVREQPTVDAVPVIRCEHCKYSKPIDSEWVECQHDKRVMKPTGFCSWADRKEDEE